jgi:hypothetical protein
MAFSGGINPRFGRDNGAPPPYTPAYTTGLSGVPSPGMPTFQQFPPMGGAFYNPWGSMYSLQAAFVGPGYPQFCTPPPAMMAGGYATMPMSTENVPGGGYQMYTTGGANGYRFPQSHPGIDPHMPAANMTNSTGGVGCEPGYNYFFPPEHTKIHLLKAGATAPWQLPANSVVPFSAVHVPTSTTLGELLKGFGATNPVPKKNKCWEVTQGGNGRWYKGLSFSADDKDKMKMSIKDLGWDMTRTGRPGEKPVVYLYVTRD